MNTIQKSHPFPFYGAGNAQYFEWIEVAVRFVKAPTASEIEKIIASAPKPINLTKHYFNGKMLLASSDQHGNIDIQVNYGKVKNKAALEKKNSISPPSLLSKSLMKTLSGGSWKLMDSVLLNLSIDAKI